MFLLRTFKFLIACTFLTAQSWLYSSTFQTNVAESNEIKTTLISISNFIKDNKKRSFNPEYDREQLNNAIGDCLEGVLDHAPESLQTMTLISLQNAIFEAQNWDQIQNAVNTALKQLEPPLEPISKEDKLSNEPIHNDLSNIADLYSELKVRIDDQPEMIFNLLSLILTILDNVVVFVKKDLKNSINTENINNILGEGIMEIYPILGTLDENNPLREGQGTVNALMSLQDFVSNAQDYSQILQAITQHQNQIQSLLDQTVNPVVVPLLQNFIEEQENANETPSLAEAKAELEKALDTLPEKLREKIKNILSKRIESAKDSDEIAQIVRNFSENIPSLQSLYPQQENLSHLFQTNLSECLNQDILKLNEKYPDLKKELKNLSDVFNVLLKCKNPDYFWNIYGTILQEINRRFENSKFKEAFLCFTHGITYPIQGCESAEEIREYWHDVFEMNEFQQFLSTCLFLFNQEKISDEEYQQLIKQYPNEFKIVLDILYDSLHEILKDFLPENYGKGPRLYFELARLFFINSYNHCKGYENIDVLNQMIKYAFAKFSYFNNVECQNIPSVITYNLITLTIQRGASNVPESLKDAWMEFAIFQDENIQTSKKLFEKMQFEQDRIQNWHQRQIFNSSAELKARIQQLEYCQQILALVYEQGKKLQKISDIVSQLERQGDNKWLSISQYVESAQSQCAYVVENMRKKIQKLEMLVQQMKLSASGKSTNF